MSKIAFSISKKTRQQIAKVIGLSASSVLVFSGLGISFDNNLLSFEQPANAQTACDTTIRYVTFYGRTSGSMTGKPDVNTNLRSNTTTSASILTTIPANTYLTFSGWAYGQGITDIWTGQLDYRWFRVSYGGKTGWVASGVIYGNPPSSSLTPTCSSSSSSSYRTIVESVLKTFFSNTANTNRENWSGKTISQMWDRIGGESAQFPTNSYTSGDRWQVDMPAEIYNIYKDLSTQIFGTVQPVTTGYAYDAGYYYSKDSTGRIRGSHSALDMDHGDYANVKAAVRGKVVKIVNDGTNGYWVAVDEVNSSNSKMGRRWWYGHVTNVKVAVGNIITPGTAIAQLHSANNFPEHLHLTVITSYSDTVAYSEVANAKTGNYSNDVQTVLNRTISPLEAYWRFRNNLKQ